MRLRVSANCKNFAYICKKRRWLRILSNLLAKIHVNCQNDWWQLKTNWLIVGNKKHVSANLFMCFLCVSVLNLITLMSIKLKTRHCQFLYCSLKQEYYTAINPTPIPACFCSKVLKEIHRVFLSQSVWTYHW